MSFSIVNLKDGEIVIKLDYENVVDIYGAMKIAKESSEHKGEEFQYTFEKIEYLFDNFVPSFDY